MWLFYAVSVNELCVLITSAVCHSASPSLFVSCLSHQAPCGSHAFSFPWCPLCLALSLHFSPHSNLLPNLLPVVLSWHALCTSMPVLHHFHCQHQQHSWNGTGNGNPLLSLCPPGMRGRAPVKFPTFLPASFFKSETAAYVISQVLDEELQKARPSELRLVSLDIASHKKAELFYRVYVFSFILCWREIAFGILWPFWDVGVLLRSKWLGSWLFPTIVEQGVGCIFCVVGVMQACISR